MTVRPEMLQILHPRDYAQLLNCPCAEDSVLEVQGDAAICSRCCRHFPVREDGILDLVDVALLDEETARELRGNTYRGTPVHLAASAAAEQSTGWTRYYAHSRKQSMQVLAQYLREANVETLFSLGSGTGREIYYLKQFMDFDTVYCSDLSATALRVVPHRLVTFEIKVGLFTSDLARVPIKVKEIPILVVNALHHTRDMHAALEAWLEYGYREIFIVEPTGNFLIRMLARLRLSQRVEYSGVRPGRLEIRKLRACCQRHGYRLSLTTLWTFPQDYFEKMFGSSSRIQRAFIGAVATFSVATNHFHFGNTTVAHLQKSGAAGTVSPGEMPHSCTADNPPCNQSMATRTKRDVWEVESCHAGNGA